MKTKIINKIAIMVCVFCWLNITACSNTVSGLEKDLHKMGESLENSADRLEKKFGDKE